MPLYEYQCEACGERFDVIQKFSDPAPEACDKCGQGPVRRQQSSPAIQFKGSGWYITDYAQKGKTGGDKAGGESGASPKDGSGTSTESSSSGESKSSESKSREPKNSESKGSDSSPSSTTTSSTSTPAKD